MRLKFGRPDLDNWKDRFDVPEARSGELAVTWLGVSTLLIDDGDHAFMTDGFFSRPPLLRVGIGRLAPDKARIDSALHRAGVNRLELIAPVHSHYDHVMDTAEVALRTGAKVVGGLSTVNVAQGGGVAADRIEQVTDGETILLPNGSLTFIESEHCPPDRYPGTITSPVVPPVRTTAYRCGEAWSMIFRHSSGRSALIQGSAGHIRGALAGQQAEVAYLGVGQLGVQPEAYIREYWDETVRTVGAKQVVLIHWDDFFRPLHAPLRAIPYIGDDLGVTMRIFDELAADDCVTVRFPTLWRRESPWR